MQSVDNFIRGPLVPEDSRDATIAQQVLPNEDPTRNPLDSDENGNATGRTARKFTGTSSGPIDLNPLLCVANSNAEAGTASAESEKKDGVNKSEEKKSEMSTKTANGLPFPEHHTASGEKTGNSSLSDKTGNSSGIQTGASRIPEQNISVTNDQTNIPTDSMAITENILDDEVCIHDVISVIKKSGIPKVISCPTVAPWDGWRYHPTLKQEIKSSLIFDMNFEFLGKNESGDLVRTIDSLMNLVMCQQSHPKTQIFSGKFGVMNLNSREEGINGSNGSVTTGKKNEESSGHRSVGKDSDRNNSFSRNVGNGKGENGGKNAEDNGMKSDSEVSSYITSCDDTEQGDILKGQQSLKLLPTPQRKPGTVAEGFSTGGLEHSNEEEEEDHGIPATPQEKPTPARKPLSPSSDVKTKNRKMFSKVQDKNSKNSNSSSKESEKNVSDNSLAKENSSFKNSLVENFQNAASSSMSTENSPTLSDNSSQQQTPRSQLLYQLHSELDFETLVADSERQVNISYTLTDVPVSEKLTRYFLGCKIEADDRYLEGEVVDDLPRRIQQKLEGLVAKTFLERVRVVYVANNSAKDCGDSANLEKKATEEKRNVADNATEEAKEEILEDAESSRRLSVEASANPLDDSVDSSVDDSTVNENDISSADTSFENSLEEGDDDFKPTPEPFELVVKLDIELDWMARSVGRCKNAQENPLGHSSAQKKRSGYSTKEFRELEKELMTIEKADGTVLMGWQALLDHVLTQSVTAAAREGAQESPPEAGIRTNSENNKFGLKCSDTSCHFDSVRDHYSKVRLEVPSLGLPHSLPVLNLSPNSERGGLCLTPHHAAGRCSQTLSIVKSPTPHLGSMLSLSGGERKNLAANIAASPGAAANIGRHSRVDQSFESEKNVNDSQSQTVSEKEKEKNTYLVNLGNKGVVKVMFPSPKIENVDYSAAFLGEFKTVKHKDHVTGKEVVKIVPVACESGASPRELAEESPPAREFGSSSSSSSSSSSVGFASSSATDANSSMSNETSSSSGQQDPAISALTTKASNLSSSLSSPNDVTKTRSKKSSHVSFYTPDRKSGSGSTSANIGDSSEQQSEGKESLKDKDTRTSHYRHRHTDKTNITEDHGLIFIGSPPQMSPHTMNTLGMDTLNSLGSDYMSRPDINNKTVLDQWSTNIPDHLNEDPDKKQVTFGAEGGDNNKSSAQSLSSPDLNSNISVELNSNISSNFYTPSPNDKSVGNGVTSFASKYGSVGRGDSKNSSSALKTGSEASSSGNGSGNGKSSSTTNLNSSPSTTTTGPKAAKPLQHMGIPESDDMGIVSTGTPIFGDMDAVDCSYLAMWQEDRYEEWQAAKLNPIARISQISVGDCDPSEPSKGDTSIAAKTPPLGSKDQCHNALSKLASSSSTAVGSDDDSDENSSLNRCGSNTLNRLSSVGALSGTTTAISPDLLISSNAGSNAGSNSNTSSVAASESPGSAGLGIDIGDMSGIQLDSSAILCSPDLIESFTGVSSNRVSSKSGLSSNRVSSEVVGNRISAESPVPALKGLQSLREGNCGVLGKTQYQNQRSPLGKKYHILCARKNTIIYRGEVKEVEVVSESTDKSAEGTESQSGDKPVTDPAQSPKKKKLIPHGFGICLWRCLSNNTTAEYCGEWKDGKFHGIGRAKQTFRDLKNCSSGLNVWGRYSSTSETPAATNIFFGEFIDGMLDGHGFFGGINGIQSFGNWKQGMMNGVGFKSYPFAEGCYEGQFVDNVREGSGRYLWKCGRVYCGQWANGAKNGEGIEEAGNLAQSGAGNAISNSSAHSNSQDKSSSGGNKTRSPGSKIKTSNDKSEVSKKEKDKKQSKVHFTTNDSDCDLCDLENPTIDGFENPTPKHPNRFRSRALQQEVISEEGEDNNFSDRLGDKKSKGSRRMRTDSELSDWSRKIIEQHNKKRRNLKQLSRKLDSLGKKLRQRSGSLDVCVGDENHDGNQSDNDPTEMQSTTMQSTLREQLWRNAPPGLRQALRQNEEKNGDSAAEDDDSNAEDSNAEDDEEYILASPKNSATDDPFGNSGSSSSSSLIENLRNKYSSSNKISPNKKSSSSSSKSSPFKLDKKELSGKLSSPFQRAPDFKSSNLAKLLKRMPRPFGLAPSDKLLAPNAKLVDHAKENSENDSSDTDSKTDLSITEEALTDKHVIEDEPLDKRVAKLALSFLSKTGTMSEQDSVRLHDTINISNYRRKMKEQNMKEQQNLLKNRGSSSSSSSNSSSSNVNSTLLGTGNKIELQASPDSLSSPIRISPDLVVSPDKSMVGTTPNSFTSTLRSVVTPTPRVDVTITPRITLTPRITMTPDGFIESPGESPQKESDFGLTKSPPSSKDDSNQDSPQDNPFVTEPETAMKKTTAITTPWTGKSPDAGKFGKSALGKFSAAGKESALKESALKEEETLCEEIEQSEDFTPATMKQLMKDIKSFSEMSTDVLKEKLKSLDSGAKKKLKTKILELRSRVLGSSISSDKKKLKKKDGSNSDEKSSSDSSATQSKCFYRGQWLNNLRHGKGTNVYAAGETYIGEWREGRKHGRGREEYGKSERYEGGWLLDERHGFGVYRWEDGRVYQGFWQAGRKQGAGVESYPNGSRYDGQWRYSQRHGIGHHVWSNHSVYLGQWCRGKKHGHGKYTFSSGEIYDGNWQFDKRHGRGRNVYATGEIYAGAWHCDQKSGFAHESYPDGGSYVGQWRENKRNGEGRYEWPDGRKYIGQWRDGAINGHGTNSWSDGSRYTGQWRYTRFDGRGRHDYVEGASFIGYWRDSRRHGEGVFIDVGGDRVEGEWVNGERVVEEGGHNGGNRNGNQRNGANAGGNNAGNNAGNGNAANGNAANGNARANAANNNAGAGNNNGGNGNGNGGAAAQLRGPFAMIRRNLLPGIEDDAEAEEILREMEARVGRLPFNM